MAMKPSSQVTSLQRGFALCRVGPRSEYILARRSMCRGLPTPGIPTSLHSFRLRTAILIKYVAFPINILVVGLAKVTPRLSLDRHILARPPASKPLEEDAVAIIQGASHLEIARRASSVKKNRFNFFELSFMCFQTLILV